MESNGTLAELVTRDDHDAGFKNVEVETKWNEKLTVRLAPVSFKKIHDLMIQVMNAGDPWLLLLASMPADQGEGFLQKLTPDSSAHLLNVAWALNVSQEDQKKILAAGLEMFETFLGTVAGGRK